MDDGRLTDGQGRTVNFKNTVVIMTSNIGSQFIGDYAEVEYEAMRRRVMEALRGFFRPEFLNRIDEIIIFHQLSRDHIVKIVDLQLDRLRERLNNHAKIDLEVTEEAKRFLAEMGYDPTYGARPLKRVIQRMIENPLSLELLERIFIEGETVVIDFDGNDILFRKGFVQRRVA